MRECTEGGVSVVAMCFALMTMIQNQRVLWPRSDKKAFYLRTDKSRSKSEALDKAFPNRRKKRKPFKSKRLSRSQSHSLTSCKPKAAPHPQQQQN